MTIKTDHRLLYLQVIDRLKRDIEAGIYEEGERLPSEFELSKQLGISRATLREALRILEDENVVVRRHGVGTFVRSRAVFSSGIEELFSVTEMIERGGKNPGTIFLTSEKREVREEDMQRFNTDEDEHLVVVERVRTADGKPVVYCLDQIPEKFMPVSQNTTEEESLFNLLEKESNRRVLYAVTHIEPVGFHERISEILDCPPEASLLVLKQMHYDQNDNPVLYSLNYFRADKFDFHVVRRRV
ncbi:GntR family transcriptional regulator [Pseudalkalibacillus berkeleyi]|uniref:GntR family transcriptional regulator n=1 Tax=Pseudalkalibacillus berkeleyi TaxID=1069813 RepID=A0ABS9H059_9BACL|nr:GntR family transcriptional regulator [Pseudalkalibacillus berkeleyi]MCF6137167.1 GntR family transcriptional regulator [Pseudalkalibacillus berkeleyi]